MPDWRGSQDVGPVDFALNVERAAEFGRLAARARTDRHITIDEVAKRLLLSTRQVRALEQPGDLSAFYGPAYFVKGLRNYLKWAGVDGVPVDLSGELLTARSNHVDGAGRAGEFSGGPVRGRWSTFVGLASAAAIAVALAGGYYLALNRADTRRATAPEPKRDVEPALLDVRARSGNELVELMGPVNADPARGLVAADPALQKTGPAPLDIGHSTGQVAVGQPTWVFVRYANNEVVERQMLPDDAMPLGDLPIFLAVGSADSLELTIAGRPVDVRPFIRRGQVRIGRDELAALAVSRP